MSSIIASNPRPTFEEFTVLRRSLTAAMPGVFDLAETRFAAAVAPQLTDLATLAVPEVGYRCHVAEQWLECFGLPATWKSRTLVSRGVRDTLGLLLEEAARKGQRWLLPVDVYPVYGALAAKHGCSVQTYQSLSGDALSIPEGTDTVLVANPSKPRGTALSASELERLMAWLRLAPTHRVVIDAVYTFGREFDPATLALLETGQALLLHSLSKGWARPLLAGVALVPDSDVPALTPLFRNCSPRRDTLALAHALLQQDRGQPQALAAWLASQEEKLQHLLHSKGVTVDGADKRMLGAYLFTVNQDWRALLAQGLLALPVSVFGSPRDGMAVVSSLPPLPTDLPSQGGNSSR